MKIIHAAPGTDPTRAVPEAARRGTRGGQLFWQENKWIVLAAIAFMLVTAYRWYNGRQVETPPPPPVQAQAAPVAADCDYMNGAILIPAGKTVNVGGEKWVTCANGVITVLQEVPAESLQSP